MFRVLAIWPLDQFGANVRGVDGRCKERYGRAQSGTPSLLRGTENSIGKADVPIS